MAIVTGSSGLLSLLAIPFVAFPTLESWPYIGLSLVLHNFYHLLLIASYRLGDLSHVYPIARGVSPLIVTLISVVLLGEQLSPAGSFAVALISVGLISLAKVRGPVLNWKPVAVALATGVLIALYTVTDGLGVRAAVDSHSYTFWLFFLDGFPLVLAVVLLKGRETARVLRTNWLPGLFASCGLAFCDLVGDVGARPGAHGLCLCAARNQHHVCRHYWRRLPERAYRLAEARRRVLYDGWFPATQDQPLATRGQARFADAANHRPTITPALPQSPGRRADSQSHPDI